MKKDPRERTEDRSIFHIRIWDVTDKRGVAAKQNADGYLAMKIKSQTGGESTLMQWI